MLSAIFLFMLCCLCVAGDIGTTLETTGGVISEAMVKSDLDWKILEAKKTPGPSDYGIVNKPQKSGNGRRFSSANPKTDLDWAIYRAKSTPGPSDYGDVGSTLKQNGGRFSTARPKTDVDWMVLEASRKPGAGQYGLADVPRKSIGARFPEGKAKTSLDFRIMEAAKTPGPGQYDLPSAMNISPKRSGGGLDRTVLKKYYQNTRDHEPKKEKKDD